MSPAAQNKKNFLCTKCHKRFGSTAALSQHADAKHPAQPETVERLQHLGVSYSTLSAAAQEAVRARLPSLCHADERLRKEGYVLPVSSLLPSNNLPAAPATYLSCPDANSSAPKAAAIVLDCEMAGAVGGQNELVRMTMVDFLSGGLLLDTLVSPSRPIENWREDLTGISADSMHKAVGRNEALRGWEAARAELWRFADKETILIGQSVHNDLKVLRALHARIIDTAIVAADAVLGKGSKIRKRWGLETLSRELVGIRIREPRSQIGGLQIHDALEDVLATREVLLTCVLQPATLERWAHETKAAFFKPGNKKHKTSGTRGKRGGNAVRVVSVGKRHEDEDEDEDEERLRWEDVVDWDMWPKSPPDSD